jgi:hypothetical protein
MKKVALSTKVYCDCCGEEIKAEYVGLNITSPFKGCGKTINTRADICEACYAALKPELTKEYA